MAEFLAARAIAVLLKTDIIFHLVRSLTALALVLAACSSSDRSNPAASQKASSSSASRGPNALMLRVPQNGGLARVTDYPKVDSTVWTATDAAPALERVLAFDDDGGLIAAADRRGLPLWIDLRLGTVTIPGRGRLRGLISVDGSSIYGVGLDGAVARFTPSENWVFKPKRPARAVYPQANGTIVVLEGRGASTRLVRLHPPNPAVTDSLALTDVESGTPAPFGERVLFETPKHALIAVQVRTMAMTKPQSLDRDAIAVASTPSGDRFYVLTDSSNTLDVVDPYRNRISARVALPGRGRDLRVDPFGRYVLVRAAVGDSVWIVSIGSDQVVGGTRSAWRGDLPFVAPDGALAVAHGQDVVFIDATSGRERQRARGGAADFWYAFIWDGFRPRAAGLDQPANFSRDTDTTTQAVPAPLESTTVRPPAPAADSAKAGFTVSFAVVLNEARAREQAAKIVVDGHAARVVTSMPGGTTVYRIVLGPYPTREEAERVGRASGQTYYVYAGTP